MHNTQLTWEVQPTHVRIFLLYLIAIMLWAAWVSFRLIRRLFHLGGRQNISIQMLSKGELSGVDLAQSALQNRNRYAELGEQAPAAEPQAGTCDSNFVLHVADSYFCYVWERLSIQVYMLRRVAFLTGLLAIWIIIYGAFPTFWDFRNNSSLLPFDCLVLTLEQLCGRLALGLFVCIILYGTSLLFRQMLGSRKSLWTYYHRLVMQNSSAPERV